MNARDLVSIVSVRSCKAWDHTVTGGGDRLSLGPYRHGGGDRLSLEPDTYMRMSVQKLFVYLHIGWLTWGELA